MGSDSGKWMCDGSREVTVCPREGTDGVKLLTVCPQELTDGARECTDGMKLMTDGTRGLSGVFYLDTTIDRWFIFFFCFETKETIPKVRYKGKQSTMQGRTSSPLVSLGLPTCHPYGVVRVLSICFYNHFILSGLIFTFRF